MPFPFTDQSGVKKRPAVVVSSNLYHAGRRDLIILAITSQIRMPLGFGEALVADWQSAGLLKPSVFKPVLTTIEQTRVLRVMGALSTADRRALEGLIVQIIG